MNFMKKQLPLAVCFITGVLCFAQYYVPHRSSQKFLETMNKAVLIVSFFAYLLGLFSVFTPHLRNVVRQRDGWGYSVILFFGAGLGVVTGIMSAGQTISATGTMTSFGWLYNYVLYPLDATMYSLLAFYIVSTSFRAFRVKGGPAFVLFVAAVVLIFGRVPLGQLIWKDLLGWTGLGISQIVEWVLNVPNVAGRRGIMIGIALGAIATSIKIIIGIEKQYLGGD